MSLTVAIVAVLTSLALCGLSIQLVTESPARFCALYSLLQALAYVMLGLALVGLVQAIRLVVNRTGIGLWIGLVGAVGVVFVLHAFTFLLYCLG